MAVEFSTATSLTDEPQHRLIVRKTLRIGIALLRGEVRSNLRKPAEIIAAFVNGERLAAHLDLVAVSGAGIFELAREAVPFVIADQLWLPAAQENLQSWESETPETGPISRFAAAGQYASNIRCPMILMTSARTKGVMRNWNCRACRI